MKWKIIKEHKREYADTSYYLKAKRDLIDKTLVLEVNWVENFMYDLSVYLYKKIQDLNQFLGKNQNAMFIDI